MLIKRKSIEKEESQRRTRRAPAGASSTSPASTASSAKTPSPKKAVARAARKPKFAPVTLSEEEGVRYLHFGTEWVQGAMRIRKPDWIELEYAQQMMAWMLFVHEPKRVVQLGLGTGALTKFCYRQFEQAQVTAIELNPAVTAVCRSMFKLPADDERLAVIEGDAGAFVADPEHHGTLDALQIDLYDATARGPVLDTAEFYADCAACLAPHGVATVNLFGDHPSYTRNLKAMRHAFDEVICLPEVHDGNVVAIAFRTAPQIDTTALYERASDIETTTKLPARSWVNGIKAWRESKDKRR